MQRSSQRPRPRWCRGRRTEAVRSRCDSSRYRRRCESRAAAPAVDPHRRSLRRQPPARGAAAGPYVPPHEAECQNSPHQTRRSGQEIHPIWSPTWPALTDRDHTRHRHPICQQEPSGRNQRRSSTDARTPLAYCHHQERDMPSQRSQSDHRATPVQLGRAPAWRAGRV